MSARTEAALTTANAMASERALLSLTTATASPPIDANQSVLKPKLIKGLEQSSNSAFVL